MGLIYRTRILITLYDSFTSWLLLPTMHAPYTCHPPASWHYIDWPSSLSPNWNASQIIRGQTESRRIEGCKCGVYKFLIVILYKLLFKGLIYREVNLFENWKLKQGYSRLWHCASSIAAGALGPCFPCQMTSTIPASTQCLKMIENTNFRVSWNNSARRDSMPNYLLCMIRKSCNLPLYRATEKLIGLPTTRLVRRRY